MLVISSGMAKSASTLLLWYTRQILAASYSATGQGTFRKLVAAKTLTGVGDYVSVLDERSIGFLLELSRREGPVVVKTHHNLTPLLRTHLKRSDVRATFCHRDPRDMILAGMDHHARSQEEGKVVFERYTSVRASLPETRRWCQRACDWVDSGLACVFRYADLVSDPQQALVRLCSYLQVPVDQELIRRILAEERARRARGRNQFNKGALTRYRDEMNEAEIRLCDRKLGRYLRRLGYPVERRDGGMWAFWRAKLRRDQAA
jgi:hypothetical protein